MYKLLVILIITVVLLIFLSLLMFRFIYQTILSTHKDKLFYPLTDFNKIYIVDKNLKDNYKIIKKEISDLDKKKILDVKIESGDIYFAPDKLKRLLNDSDGWTTGYGSKDPKEWTQYPVIFEGKILPTAHKNLPKLCDILKPYEHCFYTLFVSRLKPYGKIPTHADGTLGKPLDKHIDKKDKSQKKERLTYHFYVDCPPTSTMYVEQQKIIQRNTVGIIFDSSYNHSVENSSDKYRTIVCGKFYIEKSK